MCTSPCMYLCSLCLQLSNLRSPSQKTDRVEGKHITLIHVWECCWKEQFGKQQQVSSNGMSKNLFLNVGGSFAFGGPNPSGRVPWLPMSWHIGDPLLSLVVMAPNFSALRGMWGGMSLPGPASQPPRTPLLLTHPYPSSAPGWVEERTGQTGLCNMLTVGGCCPDSVSGVRR